MRIAVTYGPMCLMRYPEETWDDPRTGSEIGWRRIVEELRLLGHEVDRSWCGVDHPDGYDAVVSINEPYSLRPFTKAKLRVCCFWLNEFTFCKEGQYGHQDFDDFVDLYLSPSEAHRQKAIGEWGAPRPEKWSVNHLGCDTVNGLAKIPGRVVYCSSPDRGLHRVLEGWPAIRRAVPGANLRIFYRLAPWFRGFDTTPYYPPIEKLRHRALWCEEALRRLSGPEWGITVVDSVNHDQLMREMAEAEVLLFPAETVSWSEGFSCATMEGCAAGCAVIVSDCDSLGEVYAPLDPFKTGDWDAFRDRTIRALQDAAFRAELQSKARLLASQNTWKKHAERLDATIREHFRRSILVEGR